MSLHVAFYFKSDKSLLNICESIDSDQCKILSCTIFHHPTHTNVETLAPFCTPPWVVQCKLNAKGHTQMTIRFVYTHYV